MGDDDRAAVLLCDCEHTAEDHGYVGQHIASECCECSCSRYRPASCDLLRAFRRGDLVPRAGTGSVEEIRAAIESIPDSADYPSDCCRDAYMMGFDDAMGDLLERLKIAMSDGGEGS